MAAFGAKWCGAQAIPHDSVITGVDGFSGPHLAAVTIGGTDVDYKLKVGDVHQGALVGA